MKHYTLILLLLCSRMFGQVIYIQDNLVGTIQDGFVGSWGGSFTTPVPVTNLAGYWGASRDKINKSDSTLSLYSSAHVLYGKVKITGMDWDINLGYIPLKTAATMDWVGTPTIDTNFWGQNTKQTIYPTTVFQDIDYNHKTFFQVKAHTIASDSTETLPARITEIAVYSTAVSGDDLTACNTYFSVPALAGTEKWVDRSYTGGSNDGSAAKPWTTFAAAEAGISGTNPVIYVKSGVYAENSAFKCTYTIKNCLWKSVGRVEIRGTTDGSYGLFVQGANRVDINRIIVNAESRINNTYLYAGGTAQTTLNNCVFIGGSTYQISNNQTGLPILNQCVFVDPTATQNIIGSRTMTINESYLGNTTGGTFYLAQTNSNTTLNLKWNKIVNSNANSIFINSNIGSYLLFTGNDITINNCNYFTYLTAGDGVLTLNANTINSTAMAVIGFYTLSTTEQFKVRIFNNTIHNYSDKGILYFINTKYLQAYNNTYTGEASAFINTTNANAAITTDSVSIWNNTINCKFLSGYGIAVGAEATSTIDNKINDIEIYNNAIYGDLYFTPSANPTHHGIFVGFQKNAKIYRNYVNGSGDAIVVKGSIGTTYTSGGVYDNLIVNPNSYGVYSKGVSGVNIYNNTIYREDINANNAYGIYLSINTGSDGADSCKIRNNIIQMTPHAGQGIYNYYFDALSSVLDTVDYNVAYGVTTVGHINATDYNWTDWKVLGYDAHSFNQTPNFTSATQFWPVTQFNGTDLGTSYNIGLDITTAWPTVVTKQQGATWQIGAYVK